MKTKTFSYFKCGRPERQKNTIPSLKTIRNHQQNCTKFRDFLHPFVNVINEWPLNAKFFQSSIKSPNFIRST